VSLSFTQNEHKENDKNIKFNIEESDFKEMGLVTHKQKYSNCIIEERGGK